MPLTSRKLSTLLKAFDDDGWDVSFDNDVFVYNGRFGIRAHHRTADNYDTQQPKKAYYVEGNHYEMGYLLGLMAEREVNRMANQFVDRIVMDFLAPHLPECVKTMLGKVIVEFVEEMAHKVKRDFPPEYFNEIRGICDGCRQAKVFTGVEWEELWVLNVGIDCLQSFLYGLDFFRDQLAGMLMPEIEDWLRAHPAVDERAVRPERPFDLQPDFFQMPLGCNSLSVFGRAADSHYFGRDFMFPNARVFQDVAAMIIHNPDYPGSHPFVSHTAPGLVGTVAGMSMVDPDRGGVGVGVNLVAAPNCNPDRPGFNGLTLMRDCLQYEKDIDGVVERMARTRRGVGYIYPVSDGPNDRACVVEAGASMAGIPFLSYPGNDDYPTLQDHLPDQAFLDAHPSVPQQNGLMVRWAGFSQKQEYLDYNRALFDLFGCDFDGDTLSETGAINRSWKDDNCPMSYYFAPQREKAEDVLLATNFFLIPEMRLCGMDEFVTAVAMMGNRLNDFQWRYDELNRRTRECIQNRRAAGRKLGFPDVRELIDFLRPSGPHPGYYQTPTSDDGREVMISGSVSVMDLKNCEIQSHYGYHCDPWVRIRLPEYFEV